MGREIGGVLLLLVWLLVFRTRDCCHELTVKKSVLLGIVRNRKLFLPHLCLPKV